MKRLTTDAPQDNIAAMLNYVFGKDGWAHIRNVANQKDVPLIEWAKAQCIEKGCVNFSGETPREVDETLCECLRNGDGCPVALAYCFAVQACHLRSRLMPIEDILGDDYDLSQIQALGTASAQEGPLFEVGGDCWIIERGENGEPEEISCYNFVAAIPGYVIVTPTLNGSDDMDYIMSDMVEETANGGQGYLAVFPEKDAFPTKEAAQGGIIA